jgi:hypothetical protein
MVTNYREKKKKKSLNLENRLSLKKKYIREEEGGAVHFITLVVAAFAKVRVPEFTSL